MNDKVLFYFSRIAIIVPLVVVVLALVFKLLQANYSTTNQNTFAAASTAISPPDYLSLLKKIDLNSNYICHSNTNNATQSAYLQDKKFFLEDEQLNKTKYYLYNDGCLYVWQKSQLSGDKICGLAPYVGMLQNISLLNFINPQDLLSLLGVDLSAKQEEISVLVNSCKKKDVKDISLFVIPKNVIFKDKALK